MIRTYSMHFDYDQVASQIHRINIFSVFIGKLSYRILAKELCVCVCVVLGALGVHILIK